MDSLPPLSEVFHRCIGSVFEGEVFHAWNNVDSRSRNFFGPSFWPVLTCHRILFKAPLQKGLIEMYLVQVLNPDTENITMNLGQLPGEIARRLESINEEVYFQYCGRENDPPVLHEF